MQDSQRFEVLDGWQIDDVFVLSALLLHLSYTINAWDNGYQMNKINIAKGKNVFRRTLYYYVL